MIFKAPFNNHNLHVWNVLPLPVLTDMSIRHTLWRLKQGYSLFKSECTDSYVCKKTKIYYCAKGVALFSRAMAIKHCWNKTRCLGQPMLPLCTGVGPLQVESPYKMNQAFEGWCQHLSWNEERTNPSTPLTFWKNLFCNYKWHTFMEWLLFFLFPQLVWKCKILLGK